MHFTEVKRYLSRREFITASFSGVIIGLLAALGFKSKPDRQLPPMTEISPSPEKQEAVLNRLKELRFPHGSHLRTTFFPRKMVWEMAQVLKQKGAWPGGDETDWLGHLDILESTILTLKEAGIRGVRLVVASFELTQDGKTFDWKPLDTVIELLRKHDMAVDLALGPINTPYAPGIRLPATLEQELSSKFEETGVNHLTISLQDDTGPMSESAKNVREFGLYFLQELLTRYGHHPDIDKLYLSNEWPDANEVEGIWNGKTIALAEDYLLRCLEMALELSDKHIALNTNINVADPKKFKEVFERALSLLGKRGVLGLDIYPQREALVGELADNFDNYAELVREIRALFPDTEIISTEFQAEPWPPEELYGRSWLEIFQQQREVVLEYYENGDPGGFDRPFGTHAAATGLAVLCLWVGPLLPVLKAMRYEFPIKALRVLSDAMTLNEQE